MSNKLIFEPGKYWFLGYNEKEEEIESPKFRDFLNKLNIYNVGYDYSCEDNVEEALGIFWFTVKEDHLLDKVHLNWAASSEEMFKNITSNPVEWTQLSYKAPEEDMFIVKFEKLPFNFIVSPGYTECGENCIFYWNCDGNRDSSINPVKALHSRMSCDTHDFSKNSIKTKQRINEKE